MLEMVLGTEERRKLRLRRKTNVELFHLYDAELVLKHQSQEALEEARRVLGHFRDYLGDYPPSPELATGFLAQFAQRKPRTVYRYLQIIQGFMKWYGEPLGTKIRVPQDLPPYIEPQEIERLKEALRGVKTHKKEISRNLLLVDMGTKTGLRRSELANLKVKDIDLMRTCLVVRQGKGLKDRIVDLTPSLVESLRVYLKGKESEDSVFGLAPSSITNIVYHAAKKAGVNLHTHSLRHFFGTRLVDTGADMETVRRLMGHSSLNVTQRYLGRSDQQRKNAIGRLESPAPEDEGGVQIEKGNSLEDAKLVQGDGKTRDLLKVTQPEEPATMGLAEVKIKYRGETEKSYEETPHKQKTRELARELIGEITMPSILHSAIGELKPQQLLLMDTSGHRLAPPIVINENKEVSVEIGIVSRGKLDHLHETLRSHLETGGFSGLLNKVTDWRDGISLYLKGCHDFFTLVMSEMQVGKVEIPNERIERNEETGFKLMFPVAIVNLAIEKASGQPLRCNYWPIRLTNNYWLLTANNNGIYVAQTIEEVNRYQNMHKDLVETYMSKQIAKNLADLQHGLSDIGNQIHQRLQVFIDMEHVPGRCKLVIKYSPTTEEALEAKAHRWPD